MKRKNISVFDIFVYGILTMCFLVMLFPLMYVVAGSLASAKELAQNTFLIIPKNPTLDVYKYISTCAIGLCGCIIHDSEFNSMKVNPIINFAIA